MRVDFYQLGRDPAETVIPALAENTLGAGERLLVVSGEPAQLERVSKALWAHKPDSFLAHGSAGGAHDARQPILLSGALETANGARFVIIADGAWREPAEGAARVFLLFVPEAIDAARSSWRLLGEREGVERRFWKQDGGKWVEGP